MTTASMLRSLAVPTALAATLLLAAGCGKSAPTHFYSLSPTPAPQQAQPTPAGPCLSLGIGPVDFPAYLDRSQIVTRSGANRMQLAEFDQWIETPRENFQRILTENLAGLVCAKPLVTYPWPTGGHPDRQVVIQVARFDGVLGQDAVLRASWSVLDADGKNLAWRSNEYKQAAAGPDYDSLAAAQSRLVEQFAKDVADSLRQ
ncbi:MAG: PqiC family protein [Solidesulfovibrio sp.]|uniref:PqiC family protein n=1 Tax=Solidesulfovibrio sp. TaxID=2910990 RepID=UPI002B1EF470|nr:PqiC family protein [Solidesulfovibrio sp.]MEA4855797.1 PqiC family protein [Solidesulfovibrio sp.]